MQSLYKLYADTFSNYFRGGCSKSILGNRLTLIGVFTLILSGQAFSQTTSQCWVSPTKPNQVSAKQNGQ